MKTRYKVLIGFALFFGLLFASHKAIEDQIIEHYYQKFGTDSVAMLQCEGRHPIKNFMVCKPFLVSSAESAGVVWYFYHKQYGSETKRQKIHSDMCGMTNVLKLKFSILHQYHDDKWAGACGR